MVDMSSQEFAPNTPLSFEKGKLYTLGGLNLVLKEFYPHAEVKLTSKNPLAKNSPNDDLLVFKVKSGGEEREVKLFGKSAREGEPVTFTLGNKEITLTYGARRIQLPFSLRLKDFQLERYPGSMSPSSYASEVVVIDKERNKTFPYRIYMNHVLDYRGYRFFQSSYDMDEKGTILSVNHDPGTLITYIGYFLLALGMVLHFFMPQSRFQKLARLTKKVQEERKSLLAIMMSLFILFHLNAFAKEPPEPLEVAKKISKEHAQLFGEKILVQDTGGRIKPIDTLAREVLAKISRKEEIYGLTPNQVFLGMTAKPYIFQQLKLIYIHHPYLKKLLGIDKKEKYASFNDFFDFSTPNPFHPKPL